MDATFELFGLTGYAYGLCATLAAALLLALMGVLGWRRRLPAGTVRLFGLLGLPLGIIGARLVYCLFNLSTFFDLYENPWLMLRFFDGGLSLSGLLLGFALAAVLAARVMGARVSAVLDVLCAPLGLAIAVLRVGERFTELGVGKAVHEGVMTANAPWLFVQSRMGVMVEYRYNVWLYEALAGMVIALVALVFLHGMRDRARPGDAALLFACLFGASQVLWESMRDDGHMLIIFLRIGQLAAAALPLAACGVLTRRYARLNGHGGARVWLTWAGMLVCVAGVVLLEFALDGRLAWGASSLALDYTLMALLCAALAALPLSLLFTLNRRLYRDARIAVRVSKP